MGIILLCVINDIMYASESDLFVSGRWPDTHAHGLYKVTRVCLSVRERKLRKRSYELPLVSISEREEVDYEDTDCTANPTDSATGSVKVPKAYKLERLFIRSDSFL